MDVIKKFDVSKIGKIIKSFFIRVILNNNQYIRTGINNDIFYKEYNGIILPKLLTYKKI